MPDKIKGGNIFDTKQNIIIICNDIYYWNIFWKRTQIIPRLHLLESQPRGIFLPSTSLSKNQQNTILSQHIYRKSLVHGRHQSFMNALLVWMNTSKYVTLKSLLFSIKSDDLCKFSNPSPESSQVLLKECRWSTKRQR